MPRSDSRAAHLTREQARELALRYGLYHFFFDDGNGWVLEVMNRRPPHKPQRRSAPPTLWVALVEADSRVPA